MTAWPIRLPEEDVLLHEEAELEAQAEQLEDWAPDPRAAATKQAKSHSSTTTAALGAAASQARAANPAAPRVPKHPHTAVSRRAQHSGW